MTAPYTPSPLEEKILRYLCNQLGSVSKKALFKELKFSITNPKRLRAFQIMMNRLIEDQELVVEVVPDFSYCITQKGRFYIYEQG